MIAEATIDRTLAKLESRGPDYTDRLTELAHHQPELLDYLTREDTEAFTEAERELLLFAALVIEESVIAERGALAPVRGDAIAATEEANYELLIGSQAPTLRDRFTVFFERSEEEELLAFIEDLTLAEGEEDSISREAREPFFVTLKTVVDVLTI
jgi:hypothetical protein